MRLIDRPEDLEAALALARSEAANAFGSEELILEKAIERARADMLQQGRITQRDRIGADALCEALIHQGVDVIFGYPGGVILPLYDVWADYPELRTILVRHEQGAAHAADGYARASGRVAVCLGTSGPGATNLVTGIATAQLDSVPMVALTGNVPGALLGKDAFQEIAQATKTACPVSKALAAVDSISLDAKLRLGNIQYLFQLCVPRNRDISVHGFLRKSCQAPLTD